MGDYGSTSWARSQRQAPGAVVFRRLGARWLPVASATGGSCLCIRPPGPTPSTLNLCEHRQMHYRSPHPDDASSVDRLTTADPDVPLTRRRPATQDELFGLPSNSTITCDSQQSAHSPVQQAHPPESNRCPRAGSHRRIRDRSPRHRKLSDQEVSSRSADNSTISTGAESRDAARDRRQPMQQSTEQQRPEQRTRARRQSPSSLLPTLQRQGDEAPPQAEH